MTVKQKYAPNPEAADARNRAMPTPCTPRQDNLFVFNRGIGMELVIAAGSSAAFPPHTHVSTLNILLVRKGRIRLRDSAGEQQLHAGDTAIIQPDRAHGLHAAGAFAVLTLSLNRVLYTPQLAAPHRRSVQAFLNALVRSGYLSTRETRLLSSAAGAASLDSREYNDPLSLLRQTLEENPERIFPLDAMAQTAHLDKGHFIRLFKKRYRITPHGFVTQNRLRQARRLLLRSRSLTESALKAGFYDQSHFIRFFKKLHRMTPKEYVRACRPLQGGT